MSGQRSTHTKRTMADRKAWKFYLGYYRDKTHILAVAILLAIIQAGLFVPIAFLFRTILNDQIPEGNLRMVMLSGIIVFGLLLASAGVRLINKYYVLKHNNRIHNMLRNDLFARLYDIPKAFYARLENMRWHTILTHDILQLDMMSRGFLTTIAPAAIIGLGLAFVMFYINWLLFAIVVALAPIILLSVRFTTRRIRHTIARRRRAIQKYSSRINFALRMMDLTRIHGAEEMEITSQAEQNAALMEIDLETAWLNEIYRTIQDTTLAIITIILLVGGGMAAISQSISLGDLFTFYVVFMFARKYLLEIFNFAPAFLNGNDALERIYEIVGVDEELPYSGDRITDSNYEIVLENVSFSYDDEPLLKDVNLKVGQGEFVVLEGDNGSGKTTLLYLILGFYRPQSGNLRFGGVDYHDIDIRQMRKRIGVVLQETPIFRGTILENITYGRNDLKGALLEESLELSGVARFAKDLPNGLNTEVGDDGMMLSGGQRQRIAIARALCTQPNVLILDEPTNHLDKRTVDDLVRNLQDLSYAPSIIMINHTDQFSETADKIIRLDEKGMVDISPVRSS